MCQDLDALVLARSAVIPVGIPSILASAQSARDWCSSPEASLRLGQSRGDSSRIIAHDTGGTAAKKVERLPGKPGFLVKCKLDNFELYDRIDKAIQAASPGADYNVLAKTNKNISLKFKPAEKKVKKKKSRKRKSRKRKR